LVGGTTPAYSTTPTLTGTNFTGIPNAGLSNSSVTFNGTAVALGGSGTITATATNALTIGTGLSGTSYNGSAAVTIANSGVLSLANGSGITASVSTGAVTLGSTATSANTASAIVARDASGNFSAGTITASLTGNASGSAATFTSTSQNSQFNSIGVGTAGSTTAGEIRATNNVTAYYSSDERLKDNVKIIPNALAKVLQIRGVEFDWNNLKDPEDGYFVRKHDVGVIAQEIEKVLPEVVAVREDGIKAVKYDRIIPLLIEAIKELEAQVAELKAK
jgi:hypothetical protein